MHVWERDGAALLWCFAHGCDTREIIERIGLRLADLFPSDRQYTARLQSARREDFAGNAKTVANVVAALERLGRRWRVSIDVDECPCCEWPHAQLVVPSTGEPFVHCERGCGQGAFTGGLADALRGRQ